MKKTLKEFEIEKVDVNTVFGGLRSGTSSQNTITISSNGPVQDDGDDSEWEDPDPAHR